MQLLVVGVLQICGQVRRQLLGGLVVPPPDGGDLLRGGGRQSAVFQADLSPLPLELLVKRHHVAGEEQFVLHAVLHDKGVVK